MNTSVKELIKRHEGFRARAYKDSLGILTIGWGRNIDGNGISTDEAELLLANDIASAWDQCALYPWFEGLSPARQAAVIDLMFNVGARSFKGFAKFHAAMAAGNWDLAAKELESSKWFAQVKGRGPEVVNLIRNEIWPT